MKASWGEGQNSDGWVALRRGERWTVLVSVARTVQGDDARSDVNVRLFLDGKQADQKALRLPKEGDDPVAETLAAVPFPGAGGRSCRAELRFELVPRLLNDNGAEVPPFEITLLRKWTVWATAFLALASVAYAVGRLAWIVTHPAPTYQAHLGHFLYGAASGLLSVGPIVGVVRTLVATLRGSATKWKPTPSLTLAASALLAAVATLGPHFTTVLRNNAPGAIHFHDGDGEVAPATEVAVVTWDEIGAEFVNSEIEHSESFCASRFALGADAALGETLGACLSHPSHNELVQRDILPISPFTPRAVSVDCAGHRWAIGELLAPDAGLEHAEPDHGTHYVWTTYRDGGCERAGPVKAIIDLAAALALPLPRGRAIAKVVATPETDVPDPGAALRAQFSQRLQVVVHDSRPTDRPVILESLPDLPAVEALRFEVDGSGGLFPFVPVDQTWTVSWDDKVAGTLECVGTRRIDLFMHRGVDGLATEKQAPTARSRWDSRSGASLFAMCTAEGARFDTAVARGRFGIILPQLLTPHEVIADALNGGRAKCDRPPGPEGYRIEISGAHITCEPHPPPARALRKNCCLERNVDPPAPCPSAPSTCIDAAKALPTDVAAAGAAGCEVATARWCIP